MNELVLHNLDELILNHLHQKANLHGISLEEEAKKILCEAAQSLPRKSLLEQARTIREHNAHLQKSNTLDLLREDRDKR